MREKKIDQKEKKKPQPTKQLHNKKKKTTPPKLKPRTNQRILSSLYL